MSNLSKWELDHDINCIENCKKPQRIHWPHRIAVAFSQLFNTLLGGMPDETFSSRVYRKRLASNAMRYRILEKAINMVFFYESGHCFLAYHDEITQRHVPTHLIVKRKNIQS